MSHLRSLIGAAALACLSGATFASTVSITDFEPAAYQGMTAGWNKISQDFEAIGASGGQREVTSLDTNVGTFTTIGGTGTGGTVTGLAGNTGKNLALRSSNVFGRVNVVPADGKWFLDSNDTFGIRWNVDIAGKQFNKLLFALTDAADQGAYLKVFVNSELESTLFKLANGTKKIVFVDFGEAVKSATIELWNFTKDGMSRTNDGVGMDGVQVSAVPLPAGFFLLGGALAGLGALRRRRTVRA